MSKRIHLALLLLIAACTLKGQGHIGFSNSDGFPVIVLPSQTYNLSGWVVNNGSLPISGSLDIKMQVGGGPELPIENNFPIPGVLLPGDSVFWAKQGHNFPSGQFAPGNNDVLIWPTRTISGSGTVSDSIHVDMYFADEAAFALRSEGLESWAMKGIALEDHGEQYFEFENIGEKSSCKDIGLYIQINDFAPERIAVSRNSLEPSEDDEFHIEDFALIEYVKKHFQIIPKDFSADVKFFVEEEDGLACAQAQFFKGYSKAITPLAVPVLVPAIGPNPSSGAIELRFDGNATDIQLLDLQGRTIMVFPAATRNLDLGNLPAGNYLLRISTREQAWLLKLARQ